MFIDKQKLERICLDELTKIGNLFDTLKIDYCVFGHYALLAHGIKPTQVPRGTIFSKISLKEKILEMLFKMNYTIYTLKKDEIKAKKSSPSGDINVDFLLGDTDAKNFIVNYNNRKLIFSKKIFSTDTKEIWGYFGRGKSGKGYFRVAPIEEIYFSKMNSDDSSNMNELDIIKGSGKLDMKRLFQIFNKNGLI